MDIVDSATRSRMMAGIKSRNTKPEVLVRSLLHKKGLRFRLHVKDLPGHPDIFFPKYNSVIFINGCFWHGHDCPLFKWPSTRVEFWKEKILRNKAKDIIVSEELLRKGIRLAVVWECALRGKDKKIEEVANKLEEWLKSDIQTLEIKNEARIPI